MMGRRGAEGASLYQGRGYRMNAMNGMKICIAVTIDLIDAEGPEGPDELGEEIADYIAKIFCLLPGGAARPIDDILRGRATVEGWQVEVLPD
jgi:hypothetical protein